MKKNKNFDIVAILSIIFICIGFTTVLFQNDTFYTIKIGDLILKHGIDMQDHFSWISNLPYTYPHWLYDVLISIIYKINGYQSIYISNIIFYIIIGLLIYFFSKRRTDNYLFSFILTIMTIGLLIPFITARAQIISFIIFILEKHFLDKFLEEGKIKDALIIVLLSIILVNIHLAVWIFFFILFIPPIVGHYLTVILKKIKKTDKDLVIGKVEFKTNKNTKKLFIIIAICLMTGLLTPLGFTPYTYFINQFLGNSLSQILEYSNLTISNSFSFYQYLLLFLFIFLLTKAKIDINDIFLLLGLILMSLIAIRSYSYLLIIGSFIISNYLGKLTKNMSSKAKKNIDYIFNKKSELLVILICFMVIGTSLCYINNKNNKYCPEELYPIQATNFIKTKLDYKNIKLFNDYTIGSYLLYNDIPVFIDSRSDLYTKPFNKRERDIFDDYMNVQNEVNAYKENFNYYKITHILTENNNLLSTQLQNDTAYKTIYSDDYFIIFERNE